MAETVKIPIELQLEKIGQNQAELNKFVSNIQGQLNTLQKEAQKTGSFFSGLGGNLIKAFSGLAVLDLAANAISNIGSALAAPISAASEAEDNLNQLNTALALSGQYTEDAGKAFSEFASEIQATTKFEDDSVIAAGAMIQSLARLDQEGLKRATKATIDLAAALKIDLQTASQLVGKAAEGNIGAFSRYGIAIQKGKTDTETFANTLSTIEGRFTGAAAAASNTFSGALVQLKNVFGDLQEEVGNAVIKNGVLVDSIKEFKKIILDVTPEISNLAIILVDLFVDVIQFSLKATAGFIEFSRIVVTSLQDTIVAMNTVFTLGGKLGKGLSDTFNQDTIAQTNKAFDGTSFALLKINDSIDNIRKTNVEEKLVASFNKINASAKSAGKSIDENLIKSLDQLTKELENAGLTDLEKINKNEQDRLKIIKDAVNQGVITREKAAGLIAKTEIEFSQKTYEVQKKLTEEGVKDREKALQASQKRANAFLKFDLFEIVEEIKLKATLDAADIVNFAAGFASQLKRGAEGAVDVLAQGAGIIAEQFLPGIGKAVTELFKFLAQGAAKIREQILSFVKAIPDILFAVAEALQALPNILLEAAFAFVFTLIEKLPEFVGRFFDSILNGIQFLLNAVPQLILALVQQIPQVITALVAKVGDFMLALVNNLPIFIQGLVDAIPQIIQAFIDSTPLIVSSLIEQMPAIAIALAKAIVLQLPVALFKVLVSVLEKTFLFIRDNLVKAFNTIFDPIINFFKNLLGGEDGFIPDSIPLIGRFATGGVVPEGFPNDTYPAGLTSGELVIPKEDVSNLRSFLNSEKSASPARESVTNNNNDSLMLAILKTLQNIESKTGSEEIVVNVGGKQLISTIRENLKSGRVLA